MLQICIENMTTHAVWSNGVKVGEVKMVEHVPFGSFVRKFNLGNKGVAKT